MRAHNFSTRIQLLETWGAVLNWQSGSPSLLHQPLCHGLHQVDLTDLQLIENGMALPVNQILSYTGDHRCMKKYESSQQRSKMKLWALCPVFSELSERTLQPGGFTKPWVKNWAKAWAETSWKLVGYLGSNIPAAIPGEWLVMVTSCYIPNDYCRSMISSLHPHILVDLVVYIRFSMK